MSSAVDMSLSKLTPADMQTVNARLKKAQASQLPLLDSHLSVATYQVSDSSC